MNSINHRMPVLFIGHGSPMIAIEESIFTKGFETIAKELPKPKAVVCISAHWETHGVFVTSMAHPRTIHDFGGFPCELYKLQYPAPGDPMLAQEIRQLVRSVEVGEDYDWGLDHGCWSVLKYLFPLADVPVVELSIDYAKPASFHYTLAKELLPLRKEDVMIIASGNIIHNLRAIDWPHIDTPNYGYDWAQKVHEEMIDKIVTGDHQYLIDDVGRNREYHLAIPTSEHYIPLLYALALQEQDDHLSIFNDSIVGGSLDMTSLMFS